MQFDQAFAMFVQFGKSIGGKEVKPKQLFPGT